MRNEIDEDINYKILFNNQTQIISKLQDEIRNLKFDIAQEKQQNAEMRKIIKKAGQKKLGRKGLKWED